MMRSKTKQSGFRVGAFTLVELLVSIGAIVLLTAGVGRIFTSVSSLVSVGSAVSEVDQMARALERRLREDFDAFNRMRSEETFLAIRMRAVGDIDHNGVLEPAAGEIPVYLNLDDRNADRRDIEDGLIDGPYAQGSRAVTRRVDELMFIGFNGADFYPSNQIDPTSIGGDRVATHARIYYGHGLRPIPDPEWPPLNPGTGPRAPTRWYYIDGDFGTSANPVLPGDMALTSNRFDPNGNTTLPNVAGRNEFAQQWPLLRQPLLLDETAAGNIGPGALSDREIAPYPRDIELEQRVFGGGVFNQIDRETDFISYNLSPIDRPNYRRIRDGRVDVCAMSHLDVRRWLEGEEPGAPDTAGPFQTGRLANLQPGDPLDDPDTANEALWIQDNGVNALFSNMTGVQRAIAGMFNRIQVETAPPPIIRAPDPGRDEPLQPEDALMDLHAVISARCSNFEIAWSDGSTAAVDMDFNNDGDFDIKWGDIIWFDISPLAVSATQPQDRSLYQNWSTLGPGWVDLQRQDIADLNRVEITSSDMVNDAAFYDAPGYYDDTGPVDAGAMEGNDGNVPVAPNAYPAYSTLLNGGAPRRENETLVIFPFRNSVDNSAGWGDAFDKEIMIRIRVTLHDTLGRLPEGKDFEFIFTLNPQGF